MSPVPIKSIVDAACARVMGQSESVYFSEIQAEVERESGGPVGEGYLASAIERLGHRVDDSVTSWIVSR